MAETDGALTASAAAITAADAREMEHETSGGDDTALGRFRKVLKIYRALKPLFAIVGSLPLIPSTWRAAILLFDQALDALADVGGELTAGFKAGRDLEA